MWIRIGLFVLAAWLLGAHFLRAGSMLPMALCVLAPLLFLHKKRISLIVLQGAAYCASAVWLFAAWQLIEFRQQLERPWTAAALILGTVALLTLTAGLLLNSHSMRERYL